MAVVITGAGFLAEASQPSGGGSPTLDTRQRAWLGTTEISVTWQSTTRLDATVPAELDPGTYDLTVENAIGNRGELKAAYTVLSTPTFSATASVDHPTVNVGQVFTLMFTVANSGSSDVTGFALGTPTVSSTDGGSARPTGTAPSAPSTIAAGETRSFTWTYEPTTTGHVSIAVAATGVYSLSGKTVTAVPPASVPVTIQQQPSLSATASVDHSTVNVGQAFTLMFTVANSGSSDVTGFALGTPTVSSNDGGSARPAATAPGAPSTIAAGETRSFTWTYEPTTTGHISIAVAATGVDSLSGKTLTAVAPASVPVTIQQPAALTAVLDVVGSVAPGMDFIVTMRVTNTGGATARGVAPAALTLTGTSGATGTLKSGPAPASADIPGGGSATFAWTYTAGSTRGVLTIGGSAAGTDANSSAAVRASAPGKTVTIAQAPTISKLSVTSGPTTGGTSLTISGTGFQAGATVTFGGLAAKVGAVVTNSIAATTPAHPAGAVNVTVTNPDKQSGTRSNGFTYR